MSTGQVQRFGDGYIVTCRKTGVNDKPLRDWLHESQRSVRTPKYWILDERTRIAGCHMVRQMVEEVIAADGIEAAVDGVALPARDQADLREHRGVRLAARDVEGGETVVKRHRFAETKHEPGGTRREPSTPCRLRLLSHRRPSNGSAPALATRKWVRPETLGPET